MYAGSFMEGVQGAVFADDMGESKRKNQWTYDLP